MDITKLKPIGERILIKRAEAHKKSAGGIIIPDAHTEQPKEGTVVSVGTEETIYTEGDKVMFAAYAGISIDPEQEDYIIMNYNDILAVYK